MKKYGLLLVISFVTPVLTEEVKSTSIKIHPETLWTLCMQGESPSDGFSLFPCDLKGIQTLLNEKGDLRKVLIQQIYGTILSGLSSPFYPANKEEFWRKLDSELYLAKECLSEEQYRHFFSDLSGENSKKIDAVTVLALVVHEHSNEYPKEFGEAAALSEHAKERLEEKIDYEMSDGWFFSGAKSKEEALKHIVTRDCSAAFV